jgi:hypothetical protein
MMRRKMMMMMMMMMIDDEDEDDDDDAIYSLGSSINGASQATIASAVIPGVTITLFGSLQGTSGTVGRG